MRFFKASLRALIALAGTFGFLGSWILLAHALKPAQPRSVFSAQPASVIDALPTLAPLPDLNASSDQAAQMQQNAFPVMVQPQVQQAMPLFTTSSS